MNTKGILLTTLGVGVAGGASAGTYFLWPEKTKEPSTETFTKPSNLMATLTGVTFLNTKDTTNNEQWGKLVDKFHEAGTTNKINANLASKTESPSNKDSNIALLKTACDNLLKKVDYNDVDKDIAKNWCTLESELLKST